MVDQVIKYLNIREDGVYIDLTAGFGGHSKKILEKISEKGKLILVDRDPISVEFLKQSFSNYKNVMIYKINFKDFIFDLKADGILVDLGVSSLQFDRPERGFSYRFNAPLDFRMDTDEENKILQLMKMNAEELSGIIKNYSEEYDSYNIAKEIIKRFRNDQMKTTFDLKDSIIKAKNGKDVQRSLKRVFMAFRIFVNDELNSLQTLLERLHTMTNKGCRIVVISYHSLEDRIVKNFIKTTKDFYPINKKVIKPSYDEIKRNKRSRSAKMRVFERI